jgi:two-component system CheB/CheR fusion protein
MMASVIEEIKRSPTLVETAHGDHEPPEADHANNEILASVAHELRNHLGAIRNALQVFRQCGDNGQVRDWVQGVMERQTRQMGSLIEELLDFSSINRGKAHLQKQPVALERMVALAIETVRPSINDHSHVLEVTLPAEPVTLEADPTRLVQVLTNLLVNATKYTDPGGRIWLIAEQVDDSIVLRVRDTGVGIAQEALAHVFDPFWQSSRAASRSKEGLGLGLALVRQFVEMHGGSVNADSAGPGQGSEFVVRLPRFIGNDHVDGSTAHAS